ncbi:MAG: hypothetical protein ABI624_14650 [Casimicrobiaceae bacterium]
MKIAIGKSALLVASAMLAACLAGCGGGGSGSDSGVSPVVSPLAGVWSGTLTDAAGNNFSLETEHVVSGAAIKGSARIVATDGSIYHGALSGTETAAGMDWSVDFRDSLGLLDFKGTRNGKNLTLTYAPRATPGAPGNGTLNFSQAGGADLRGTYQVDWIANKQTGSFLITVVNDSGVNSIAYLQVQVVNGLMVFGGSCIGSTISVGAKVLAGATGSPVSLVQMHFGGTAVGSPGFVSGTSTAQSVVTPIQGEFRLTKVSG